MKWESEVSGRVISAGNHVNLLTEKRKTKSSDFFYKDGQMLYFKLTKCETRCQSFHERELWKSKSVDQKEGLSLLNRDS